MLVENKGTRVSSSECTASCDPGYKCKPTELSGKGSQVQHCAVQFSPFNHYLLSTLEVKIEKEPQRVAVLVWKNQQLTPSS